MREAVGERWGRRAGAPRKGFPSPAGDGAGDTASAGAAPVQQLATSSLASLESLVPSGITSSSTLRMVAAAGATATRKGIRSVGTVFPYHSTAQNVPVVCSHLQECPPSPTCVRKARTMLREVSWWFSSKV